MRGVTAKLTTIALATVAACDQYGESPGETPASCVSPCVDGGNGSDVGPVSGDGGDGGGSEGGADGGTGNQGFCEAQSPAPAFCFDFDDGKPLTDFFAVSAASSAPISVDTTDPKSGPAALLVVASPGAPSLSSRLTHTLPKKPGSFYDVQLDVKLDVSQLLTFELAFTEAPAPAYRFEMSPGNESFYFAEKLDDTTKYEKSNPGLFPQTWEHFRFRVDFVTRTYEMWIGPAKVLSQPMTAEAHSGIPSFAFGAVYSGGGAFSVRVDNVIIDGQ